MYAAIRAEDYQEFLRYGGTMPSALGMVPAETADQAIREFQETVSSTTPLETVKTEDGYSVFLPGVLAGTGETQEEAEMAARRAGLAGELVIVFARLCESLDAYAQSFGIVYPIGDPLTR